ncbi:MAG: HU family DNA-binding protein [Bacteroidales bacterium]|nr:HU family DNA-binding protein [Bacteroidales bacterium]MDD4822716.1 HU family DNA-binding protein [Bacteroidales bacterium]
MSVKYELFKSPVANRENGEVPKEYARIVHGGMIPIDKLAEEIADASSFTKGDVMGMLTTIAEGLARHLSQGESVELEGLGIFSVGLERKKGEPEKDQKGLMTQFSRVKFRASRSMKRKLSTMRLVKSKECTAPSLTDEQRLQVALTFLNKTPFMTRMDYQRITGLHKSAAIKDLNRWVSEGKIFRHGLGNNVFYFL